MLEGQYEELKTLRGNITAVSCEACIMLPSGADEEERWREAKGTHFDRTLRSNQLFWQQVDQHIFEKRIRTIEESIAQALEIGVNDVIFDEHVADLCSDIEMYKGARGLEWSSTKIGDIDQGVELLRQSWHLKDTELRMFACDKMEARIKEAEAALSRES